MAVELNYGLTGKECHGVKANLLAAGSVSRANRKPEAVFITLNVTGLDLTFFITPQHARDLMTALETVRDKFPSFLPKE